MSRISAGKLKLFNEAIRELYANAWTGRLPEMLPSILELLIPGELMIFNSLDPEMPTLDTLWTAPLLPNWPEVLAAVAAFAHEHPTIGRRSTAQSVSDHLSRGAWHRTSVYAELMRPLGVDDDLGIDVPIRPGLIISLCQQRSGWRFQPEERALLDLLQPHLRQAWQQAERAERQGLGGGIPENLEQAVGHGLLRVDELGRMLAWFKEGCRQRLEGRLGENPHRPLRLTSGEATLWVQLVTDAARGNYFLILEEEAPPATPGLLHPLGLSPREQEVLFWVAQGKTNKDVAKILGISVRTIKRHLENIYAQLEVDGRHAASHAALEYLRGGA